LPLTHTLGLFNPGGCWLIILDENSKLVLPLPLSFNLLIKYKLNGLLGYVFFFYGVFIRKIVVIFGFILKFDPLLHFLGNFAKHDVAFIENTNLEIIAHWSEKAIEFLENM